MRKPVVRKDRDDREAQDFRAAVHGVKQLPHSPVPAGLVKPKPKPRKRAQRDATQSEIEAHGPPSIDADALPDETLSFRRPGVQDQVIKRLRRGLIPTQAQIDLHGLTQRAAWDCMIEFIGQCREQSLRCVQVIHGKGYRSGARGPVLKSAVNSWLRRNHDVVAFTSARAIDGGAGALYVLLRA